MALVTGAGRGIGRAIALGFAREGADLIAADRDADLAERTAGEVRALGPGSEPVRVDVARRDQVEAMVERGIVRFGRIDVLVSNAGISRQHDFVDLPEDDWDEILGVNLKGVFLCGQAIAREMIRAGGGAIVNVVSQRAESPTRRQAAYAASKGGVKTLTKAMALDLAPYGIRVNGLGPGATLTDLNRDRFADPEVRRQFLQRIPLGRFGEPEDMVGAAVFLASDEARYVTGHCLFVDGGWLAG